MKASQVISKSNVELSAALQRARTRYDKSPSVNTELTFKVLNEEYARRMTATDATNGDDDTFPRRDIIAPANILPTPCTRCGGAGGSKHWPGFVCYRCGGCKDDPTRMAIAYPRFWHVVDIAQWESARDHKSEAAAQRRADKRREAIEARVAAFAERFPDAYALIIAHATEASSFTDDDAYAAFQQRACKLLVIGESIYASYITGKHDLTTKQADVVARVPQAVADHAARIAADEAAKAEALDIECGRYEIEGVVAAMKPKETPYGIVIKGLIKLPSGGKVWGTIPSALLDTCDVGSRVRFVATVDRSDNDSKFGFYSRPTKAAFVA